MNLVPCALAGDAADLGAGARLPLPADLAARAGQRSAATFGVRPENLGLAPTAADALPLNAEVLLREPLGAETLVTFRVGQVELVARCPADFAPAPGTPQVLHVRPQHLHLFDSASGVAI